MYRCILSHNNIPLGYRRGNNKYIPWASMTPIVSTGRGGRGTLGTAAEWKRTANEPPWMNKKQKSRRQHRTMGARTQRTHTHAYTHIRRARIRSALDAAMPGMKQLPIRYYSTQSGPGPTCATLYCCTAEHFQSTDPGVTSPISAFPRTRVSISDGESDTGVSRSPDSQQCPTTT